MFYEKYRIFGEDAGIGLVVSQGKNQENIIFYVFHTYMSL